MKLSGRNVQLWYDPSIQVLEWYAHEHVCEEARVNKKEVQLWILLAMTHSIVSPAHAEMYNDVLHFILWNVGMIGKFHKNIAPLEASSIFTHLMCNPTVLGDFQQILFVTFNSRVYLDFSNCVAALFLRDLLSQTRFSHQNFINNLNGRCNAIFKCQTLLAWSSILGWWPKRWQRCKGVIDISLNLPTKRSFWRDLGGKHYYLE